MYILKESKYKRDMLHRNISKLFQQCMFTLIALIRIVGTNMYIESLVSVEKREVYLYSCTFSRKNVFMILEQIP